MEKKNHRTLLQLFSKNKRQFLKRPKRRLITDNQECNIKKREKSENMEQRKKKDDAKRKQQEIKHRIKGAVHKNRHNFDLKIDHDKFLILYGKKSGKRRTDMELKEENKNEVKKK